MCASCASSQHADRVVHYRPGCSPRAPTVVAAEKTQRCCKLLPPAQAPAATTTNHTGFARQDLAAPTRVLLSEGDARTACSAKPGSAAGARPTQVDGQRTTCNRVGESRSCPVRCAGLPGARLPACRRMRPAHM